MTTRRRFTRQFLALERKYSMSIPRALSVAFIVVTAAVGLSVTRAAANPLFGYEVETDVVFAQGEVTADGVKIKRNLMLDVYTPTELKGDAARPSVILVHGGAYHRGGRRQPPYRESGAVHSRMEDYARLLAPLGYVCFVIEYRLAPELPRPLSEPGSGSLLPLDEVVTPAGLARTNFARRAMGLPELADDESIVVWNAAMAGAEDTAKAVEFVRANAAKFGVDTDKIALGGHSAGGGNVLNAAFGLNAPVAAVFPLSPPAPIFDTAKVMARDDLPPTLLVISQYDLEAILESAPKTIAQLRAGGSDAKLVWVPGFPHFYPTGAVTLGDDGTRMSVGERVIHFLDTYLRE
jgi:predicted esterase